MQDPSKRPDDSAAENMAHHVTPLTTYTAIDSASRFIRLIIHKLDDNYVLEQNLAVALRNSLVRRQASIVERLAANLIK